MRNKEIKLLKPSHDFTDDMLTIVQRNKKEFEQWLPWVKDYLNENLSYSFMEGYIKAFGMGIEYRFFIYLNVEEKIIGTISIRNINLENHTAEIGYWLDKNYTGHGFIVKSYELLLSFIKEKKIKVLYAKTHYDNYKSINTLKKLGFSKAENNQEKILLFKQDIMIS